VSFILEALRKSESDRQRLGNVALADLPIARRRRGQPWWVFALGALLLVNSVVLIVVLMRDKPATTPATKAAPVASAPNNAPINTHDSRISSAPAPITPAVSTSNPLQAATAHIEYETISTSERDIANAAASVPDGQTLVRPSGALQGENKGVPSATSNLAAAERPASELHIDLHVYSKNSNERFVLINMHRYTEGQQLPNGAVVEQITPQGVVVQQNGLRYQIDRQ
jgi:general secretion pathway protein B